MGRWAFAVLVVIVASLGSRRALAQHDLLGLPLDDPAYLQLDALVRRGCGHARISFHRPYLVADVRSQLERAAGKAECEGPLLRELLDRFGPGSRPSGGSDALGVRLGGALDVRATALGSEEFRPMWEDLRPTAEGDPPLVAIARARLTWEGEEHLYAAVEGYLQSDRRNDPRIRARRWRESDVVIDYSEAYLTGRLGRLVLSFGRADEAWGSEGRESLMLSAHGPPLDRAAARLRWDRLEARALWGMLDDVVLTAEQGELAEGIVPQRYHRMLFAHALTWRPGPSFELTIGETVLLARGSRTIDLTYANPLMLYLVAQEDTARTGVAQRANRTAFASIRGTVGVLTLHGELLVDDLQIDRADRAVTPDQLGWRLEAGVPLHRTANASGSVVYRRVDSYTYMRSFYSEVYQHYDRPLGSELGPGADLLTGQVQAWRGPVLRFTASAGLWRRGGLRIDARPGEGAGGRADEPFPSVRPGRPEVQQGTIAAVGVDWLRLRSPVSLTVEGARLDNPFNQPGEAVLFWRARLSASFRYGMP